MDERMGGGVVASYYDEKTGSCLENGSVLQLMQKCQNMALTDGEV